MDLENKQVEMSEEEKLFQRYYNEVPGVAVSIINKKLSEAVQEIREQIGNEVELVDLYRCTSYAMIGVIEYMSQEYEITDDIRKGIVEELSVFLDSFTSKDRPLKELYMAPHILVDMVSYMIYQRMVEEEV